MKNPQTSTSLRNAYLSPKITLFKEESRERDLFPK